MIATIGAVLEAIAVLGGASAMASLAVPAAVAGIGRLRVAPAIRADLLLAAAALPAGLVVAVAVAVAVPGALDQLGVARDHCGGHVGHAHLCLAHPAAAAPSTVALGSIFLAGTLLRAGRWLSARAAAARALSSLLRLGERGTESPDVVRVDGSAVLCHATGTWTPRVLVSSRLLAGLSADLLSAALDHERAHLRRRDVLSRDVLSLLGLLSWPGVAGAVARAWEDAAEEAADAAAAERHGGDAVARALVAVARMSLTPTPAAMPITGARVARRVHALLDGPPPHRPARALAAGPALGLVLVALAGVNAGPLHHLAESALRWILGA
jgi:Zn-dependent protease with chaperone function